MPAVRRSLRVALLNPVFWPEVRRGSERFARDLADGLLERGHRPRLITSHRGRPRRDVEDGLVVVRHWRAPDGPLRRRLIQPHLTHLPFAYASLRAGDDDIAHALHPADALAALRWREHTGRPVVLSWMGIPHRRELSNLRGRLAIAVRATRGADAVVALSRAAADGLQRWLGVRARVIAPGVDLAAFAPRPGARAPAPTILCPAAVDDPRKRTDLLLEAFARVRARRADVRLVLADRGAGAAPPPGVELVDLDDRGVLAHAYARAWVTALPSFGEAFGLVLAESLACGTPVVGRRDGAIAELIDRPAIGRLFDGDDPTELAGALLQALELAGDPATGAACRARGEDFAIGRTVKAYLALYRELLGGH